MSKKPDTYFISDFHFSDDGLINWERTQFSDCKEHNDFVLNKMNEWYMKVAPGSKLYVLGDFGDTDYLSTFFDAVSGNGKWIELNYIYGNHDKASNYDRFAAYFDNVYLYPQYLSQKLILSHEPVWPIPPYALNIHGHLHKAKLDSPNHISVSCNDIGYKPFKLSDTNGYFARLEPRNMKFLWEPYADHYIMLDKAREDIVCNPLSGKIDLAASRAFQKSKRDENWNLIKVE